MTNNQKTSLETRLFEFLETRDDIENIDAIKGIQGKKADYLYAHQSCIVEVKNMESDPTNKIDSFIEKLKQQPEYPVFFGKRTMSQIFEHFNNPQDLSNEFFFKITHQIEAALKKANRQIQNTKNQLHIPKSNGVVILLNDQIATLDPEHLATRAAQVLNKKLNGKYRYTDIELIIVMSETHTFNKLPQFKETLPIICIEGPACPDGLADTFDPLFQGWSIFNGSHFSKANNAMRIKPTDFQERKVEDKNEDNQKIKRHELWRKEYRKARYAKHLTEDDFLRGVGKVMTRMFPHFLKDKPNLEQDELYDLMEEWTHCLEEAELRNLNMKDFSKYWDKSNL